MGFIKFLLGFFLFVIITRILFRLFRPQITRWFVGYLQRKVEEQQVKQRNAFNQQHDPDFKEEVHLNKDVKVKVPREDKKTRERKAAQESDIEDVEFEEIKDE